MDINSITHQLVANPYIANLLSWIFLGLIVGVVAKLLLPGQENLGWIRTIVVGIAGAFLGGLLAAYAGYHVHVGWNLLGFVAAVIGALILLIINRVVTRS